MNKKKKHINASDVAAFQRYINNEISSKEAHTFERQLLNDPFEADALDGLSLLDSNTLNKDLQTLKNTIHKKTIPLWKRPSFYAAASILVIIGVFSLLWMLVPDGPIMVSENQPLVKTEKEIMPMAAFDETDTIYEEEELIEDSPEENLKKEKPVLQPKIAKTSTPITKEVPRAKKMQGTSSIQLSDNKDLIITNHKEAKSAGRVEETVMPVDYGTLDGESFAGLGSSADDKSLTIVKGRVTDSNFEPLPGATISVRGTQIGTVADIDGNYQISIPAQDTSKPLDAFFIGFRSQELAVNSDSTNFALQEDLVALSEVVAIGYGSKKSNSIDEFQKAEPLDGWKQYLKDIEKTLRYPINGTGNKELVVALVTINQTGKIKNIEIKRSPGEAYSIEVIRAIRNGAEWKPASNKGFPIQDTVKVKLRFYPKNK